MEHRYAKRHARALPVMVSCPRLGMVRALTVNISSGGMFVASDCVSLPMNAPVTIAFQPVPEDVPCPCPCLQADGMVVHQSSQGFGVMFDDLEPACRGMLAEVIGLASNDPDAPQRKAGLS